MPNSYYKMSKDFIEKRYNGNALNIACRQHKQLSYYTTSEVQEDIRSDYFDKFAERKFFTSDVLLNWVKQILKDDNFLSFAKYHRNPNPSSSLINNRIKEPLSRVFFSEDAHFNYTINGKPVENPKELEDGFEQRLFNALIFNHNDIIVHDLEETNKPFREFISIDKVVSIDVNRGDILRIAYSACVEINGEKEFGYAYLDNEKYEFYNKDYDLLLTEPHDYGRCPATFVVRDTFYPEGDERDPNGIVKLSIFSHVREDLEFYSFIKVLQKLTDVNGAFPIYVTVDGKGKNKKDDDFDSVEHTPMSVEQLGGQVSLEARGTAGAKGGGVIQPGTEIKVKPSKDDSGKYDMELMKNFITFYHAPVNILEHINKRVAFVENNIISYCIGEYSDRNDVSMTEMQVQKGFVSRDDKLRWVSTELSFSRQNSDHMMLSLAYGKENVNSDIFYGSDFFLETPAKLYEMFKIAPNSIERRNILTRLSQRRNMFNKDKQKREFVLYKLLPYSSDKDFEVAYEKSIVDYKIFELQTRFDYWIARFESIYGKIELFWNSIDATESEKITEINNLILNLIPNGKEVNSETKSIQRTET